MIVWALFDSGNGCYKQAIEKYFLELEIEVFSIGMDIENRNSHFLHVDLSSFDELFGKNTLFERLDKLPKPDVILASPPCESWSVASSMENGNRCWYTQKIETLLDEYQAENHFTLRTKEQLERNNQTHFRAHWYKTVYNRINGELCAFNTIRIIERYEPKIWVIENPQSSKMWKYFHQIHQFEGYKNVAYYYAYDKNFSRKPTTFYSNVWLNLLKTEEKASIVMSPINKKKKEDRKTIGRSYNQRSNIPLNLIEDIMNQILQKKIFGGKGNGAKIENYYLQR